MNLHGGLVAEHQHERKERLMKEIGAQLATLPSTDWENRYNRLYARLLSLCDGADRRWSETGATASIGSDTIRRILKENA